ncbi:MAG: alpha-ketoacid dehydrogenase subunit beta [Candidatus Marinimicrobia bacterium]|nr:alpha-ketoacid dehydrogenase subunit beta [Candidatus Neomarinimicrobiota bacterium]
MTELRFAHAINRALTDSMEADENVVTFGEDVAKPGGPFGVTKGLLDKFGSSRVRDTPISEAAITGTAVGAAMSGLKPVVEIMFIDFITLAMDALVNQAAKARFMFGGQFSVPMVVRTPHGGGVGAGPQHSQCLEVWLAHVPGLKVVCPSTIADAYGLLRAAINDPDPVIYVENKSLYAMKGELPEAMSTTEIGKASIARKGNDVTLVTYGAMRSRSLEAANLLASEGVSVEVIDLRSIQPWDEQMVLDSLSRTHRLVVCHEAVEAYGVGAEIIARMVDIGFDSLDAPPLRVAAPFMPPPYAPSLENEFVPSITKIVEAVRLTLA